MILRKQATLRDRATVINEITYGLDLYIRVIEVALESPILTVKINHLLLKGWLEISENHLQNYMMFVLMGLS